MPDPAVPAHDRVSPPASLRQPATPIGPLPAILLIVYAAALALSAYLAMTGEDRLGAGGALLVLTMAPVAFSFALGGSGRQQKALIARVEELTHAVRVFTDHAALSDDARRVLSRGNDRALLTQAIEEDVRAGNLDAAMILVNELADRFGFRDEAEEHRRRIEAMRAETTERRITESIQYLDGLILQRRWDEAFADASRLLRLFPDSQRIFGLRGRIERAQRSHRDELERRFLLAAQEERTDDALGLLRELDAHLSPAEAEPLRELARGVIGKAKENLGASFRLAVQDRRWAEAARIGDRIIAEFPNTRMAAEIRDVIDGIRQRAGVGSA